MKTKTLLIVLLLLYSASVHAQKTDTLSFYSAAFDEERTVYVHLPKTYIYQAETVKLPVIYLLDGQHEWFINPVRSDIEYLQYTHEIPAAIVVVIPHNNRVRECGISDLDTPLPLHTFITEELTREIAKYNPGECKVLMGHSYSASFALYSYLRHPEFYSAVIAHSPLNKMKLLISGLEKHEGVRRDEIYLSIGSKDRHKDGHHREAYEQLKATHPRFFAEVHLFEADKSNHTAVPIVATPPFLTAIFEVFSGRYAGIARVDNDYKLIDPPGTLEEEMQKVVDASRIGSSFFPPEIAELNGLASRYSSSGYDDIARSLYELGITHFPHYFEFHLALFELSIEADKPKAKAYLLQAESLLKNTEPEWEGKDEVLQGIQNEKAKHGW
jgi:predicted alpha/beta superfamily hydrolase